MPPRKLSPKAELLLKRVLARYSPPPRIKLSDWAENHIVLPEGQSARPGKYRNWPYFREPLDSIGDLSVERISLMKSARCGFTKGLIIAIAANVENNPGPMGLLVPTDDDAKGISVDELQPMLDANPEVGGLLVEGRDNGRNTLTRKQFRNGASVKVLAARAPRNLRRHDFKFLYCDEVDAMEITAEGDPIVIAERRTMAHPDRKIVIGSTPTEEEISIIERSYAESDQRIYEIQCVHQGCRQYFELLWEHIQWPEGEPEKASAWCPHCGCEFDERRKREMVEAGRWRATKPEVRGHRGYRLNALVSLLANAAWPTLAKEFLKAKRGGPAEMQPFYNTVLAKPWKTSLNRLTADGLAARAEPFGLERVPIDVLMITVGADVQDDRIEATVLGWPMVGAPYALGHVVVPGSTLNNETWSEFDKWLKGARWHHPNGWTLRVDACAIDSGGSKGRTQKVYNFCNDTRLSRRIFAIKGMAGPRPMWQRAAKAKNSQALFLIGHDPSKTSVLEALAQPVFDEKGAANIHCLRVSEDLSEEWFDQAAGEIRRVRYVRNRPTIEFVPKRPGQRVEALDCLVYGWAVRYSPEVRSIDLRERAARKAIPPGEVPVPAAIKRVGDWAKLLNG